MHSVCGARSCCRRMYIERVQRAQSEKTLTRLKMFAGTQHTAATAVETEWRQKRAPRAPTHERPCISVVVSMWQFFFISVLSLLSLHSCFFFLTLSRVWSYGEPILPMNSVQTDMHIETNGDRTKHEPFSSIMCTLRLCISVRVWVCECISQRCHFLWFVYQCSSDGCLFKVHNDIHTCIQSIIHSIVLLTTMRNVKYSENNKTYKVCFVFVSVFFSCFSCEQYSVCE